MKETCFFIAEAGVNHNGDLQMALRMVDVAAAAGADAIKFQTFTADSLTTSGAPKADYQKVSTGNEESQQAMLTKLELDLSDYPELFDYCQRKNIEFMSTAFDEQSLDFLIDLGIKRIKIPSGELTNLPLVRHIASKNLPVIVSTGMATLQEIDDALQILYAGGITQSMVVVLQCNSAYPTPCGDANLACLPTIHKALSVAVGYSDHTLGDEVAIASVALGAVVIEKHFTLDRNLPGPDQSTSLEPNELTEMVKRVRNVEQAIGNGIKEPSDSEKQNIAIARKSIVAKMAISKGDIFTQENLTTKRPGTGLSPMLWDEVLGQVSMDDFMKDDLIEL